MAALTIRGVLWQLASGPWDGPVTIDGGRLWLHESPGATVADLSSHGLVARPGLINAHDHLDFGGFPTMAHGAPYADYVAWAEDVTARRTRGDLRAWQELPLARRLVEGALRNLSSGVTSVAHMNPYVRRVFHRREFPVNVLGEGRHFHSLAFGGDLAAFLRKVRGKRFMVHACEGVSERARAEAASLAAAGALGPATVLVHATALDEDGARLVARAECTLVVCPRSNETLYGKGPDVALLRAAGVPLALGSDSPLSGPADLLADMAAARALGMTDAEIEGAVGTVPARAFGRPDLGRLEDGHPADIAFVDAGAGPTLLRGSIALVVRGGRPLLARRPGLIASLGAEEIAAAGGLLLEARLHSWCAKLQVNLDGV